MYKMNRGQFPRDCFRCMAFSPDIFLMRTSNPYFFLILFKIKLILAVDQRRTHSIQYNLSIILRTQPLTEKAEN